ncbi:hypothetical protein DHD32_20255 [Arenibacter sp. TNZ]|uniref:trypsin-like peptidase domain-containing protein n=1 Tax=Arenibacter TaxID=178469 RepID=UPI000CD3D530|nr:MULTISPECIES: trypsin-like peptidase domain-containing protein [Arenibacter]MCM4173811.1 hypothetical protein [Arenibacter sp. TNZ]
MSSESIEEFCFPVIGYHLANSKAIADNLFGTASYINNNIFITAAHSILNAHESEIMGIAIRNSFQTKSGYTYHRFEEFELFEDLDIGILKLKGSNKIAKAKKWSLKNPIILEDVYSYGFPFGLNALEKELIVRGLKGYVVTSRKFHEFKKTPRIHELSFHCPKGISGASLHNSRTHYIQGFIIGNASTEMMIFEEKEVDEKENKISVFQKYETTKYGIAILVDNLLDLHSEILGKTFRDYLNGENLLV